VNHLIGLGVPLHNLLGVAGGMAAGHPGRRLTGCAAAEAAPWQCWGLRPAALRPCTQAGRPPGPGLQSPQRPITCTCSMSGGRGCPSPASRRTWGAGRAQCNLSGAGARGVWLLGVG
jgi:hypothetical protein